MAMSQDDKIKQWASLIERWRYDPYAFVMDNWGGFFDERREAGDPFVGVTPQQKLALEDIGRIAQAKVYLFDHRKDVIDGVLEVNAFQKKYGFVTGISIKGGQGTGKDSFVSWVMIWFLTCWNDSQTLATANTKTQLLDVLWSELAKWIRLSNVGHKEGSKSWISEMLMWHPQKIGVPMPGSRLEHANWWAVARTSAATDNSDQKGQVLAGRHADHQMFVIDEASGVPDPVWNPILGTLTGKLNFVLVIFNPTRNTGEAAKTHKDNKDLWILHTWNAEECPLVSPESIKRQKLRYGEETDAYRVWVKGEFPTGDGDSLIPFEWIQRAIEKPITAGKYDSFRHGIDLGLGGDSTAFIYRHGSVVGSPSIMDSKDSVKIADWATRKISETDVAGKDKPDGVYIDRGGPGADAYKLIKDYCYGINVVGVHFGEDARDKVRFVRRREEMWWLMRTAFEKDEISIPNHKVLIEELASQRYKHTEDGRIRLQSKDDMKKSPNIADALALTFYDPDEINARDKIKQKLDLYRTKFRSNQQDWFLEETIGKGSWRTL